MEKKVNLNIISKKPTIQKNFIMHAALTFRLKHETIAELFDIKKLFNAEDEVELYKELVIPYKNTYDAFLYLFNYDPTNQIVAKDNFFEFYNELKEKTKINIEDAKDFLGMVYDAGISDLLRKNLYEMTDEEVIKIAKYQLKYALTTVALSANFGYAKYGFEEHVKKAIKNDQNLMDRYNDLMEYNNYLKIRSMQYNARGK